MGQPPLKESGCGSEGPSSYLRGEQTEPPRGSTPGLKLAGSGDSKTKYLLDLGTRSQVLTRVKIEFRY